MEQKRYGGKGGGSFVDLFDDVIIGFNIRHGAWIDGIQAITEQGPGKYFGGTGGGYDTFLCERGQKIVGVNIRSGYYIDALQFVSSDGKQSKWFGGKGGGF